MAKEIERKFLVTGDGWRRNGEIGNTISIKQGYLNRDKQRTVRIRITDNDAFITVKGLTIGASRSEFEYSIPIHDAQIMLEMCEGAVISKVRHLNVFDGNTWEVDEFLGQNAGLIIAEIELSDEQQEFKKPDWVVNS